MIVKTLALRHCPALIVEVAFRRHVQSASSAHALTTLGPPRRHSLSSVHDHDDSPNLLGSAVVSLTWVIVLTFMVHVCLSVDAQVVRQLVVVSPPIRLKRLQLVDDIKEAGGQVALPVAHGTSLGHMF